MDACMYAIVIVLVVTSSDSRDESIKIPSRTLCIISNYYSTYSEKYVKLYTSHKYSNCLIRKFLTTAIFTQFR